MNLSSLVKHSVLLTAASAALAACSGGPQSALIPASQTAAAITTSPSRVAQQAIKPPTLPICPPFFYHGAAEVWDANAGEWITYVGWFGWVHGGLEPCPGDAAVGGHNNRYSWFSTLAYCYPWLVSSQARRATQGPPKKDACLAVPVPSQNAVDIVKSTGKKTSVLDTISTAPDTPTSTAVSSTGTLYVAVAPTSGSQSSGIMIFPQTSTTSSGMLSDPNLGQNPAQIAVDRRGDLFVAYTVTSGSTTSAQIDEFPAGSTNAIPFATVKGVAAGAVATTRRDDVLLSTIAGSSGAVEILDIKGRMAGKIATTANPALISLNSKNDALTVDDPTDNLVSTYAYPSGKLEVQGPVGNASQTWIPEGMLQP